MTKTIFGVKGLALTEYAIAANAILGIRDSGKTYTATEASEELFEAGIPFIWLDPIGVAHNLRIPGKGKDARGYPVVVAGGKHGDLPLTVKSVGTLVRAAMKGNISLVLDLFSVELTKADWKRIVKETCEILLHENAEHGLRHVFIEEAAEFVPQILRGADGQVFSAVEKLVRMGGNSKVGITLINQRSADLNKSVLELCANVFVHRQRGKNTLTDLKKWLSMTDPATEKEITASLPDLDSGQCWVMSNDLKTPVLIKVPAKHSLHPDRRAAPVSTMDLDKHKPVPADAFVAEMKAALAPKSAPAPVAKPSQETSKPVEKTNIASQKAHERALAAAREEGAAAVRARLPALLDGQHDVSFQMGVDWARGAAIVAAKGILNPDLMPARRPLKAQQDLIDKPVTVVLTAKGTAPLAPRPAPERVETRAAAFAVSAGATGLGKAERAILGVVAHFPREGVSKAKAALMAGYSATSGSFRNTLSVLRTSGLIRPGEPLVATDEGLTAAGNLYPLPTGNGLLAYWQNHQALGKCEGTILEVLVEALWGGNPEMDKADVASRSGYEASSGSFRNALSILRTLGLIRGKGGEPLRAAEEFA